MPFLLESQLSDYIKPISKYYINKKDKKKEYLALGKITKNFDGKETYAEIYIVQFHPEKTNEEERNETNINRSDVAFLMNRSLNNLLRPP